MPSHPALLSLVVLRMALHPPLLVLGGSEGVSDRPEEHPGGCGAHMLEFVLEILKELPFARPKTSDVLLHRAVLLRQVQNRPAFSTVARTFFSFRTIPESCINARMSRSDSLATFSGEKSRNAFRKWGHFFSIIHQFKPTQNNTLSIRYNLPSKFSGWSS